ncbi:MAG: T9SS type A sorting domain-containing protein [Chitinophagales bacterium]
MKILSTIIFLTIITAVFSKVTQATIHSVPSDFSTIQSAINSAIDGDTIVVATGIYYENLNFKGKNIVLTSNYYLTGDTSFVNQTIINGSQPADADTGSCVIFSSGEDSTAVLMGFTITGGTGTVWLDAHGAGTYREGGGVLIDFSSPTIRNNRIIDNLATNSSGINGAGGGGIRISDCNPYILNNLIAYNKAKYGPGVVLNYTGCIMRNNIIAYNSGGQNFNGGGAIWSNTNSVAYPKIIENNTIYRNQASVGTGGCLAWGGTLILRNNILWGNYSIDNSQVKSISGVATVTYCDVEGGYSGIGNIDVFPDFTDTLSFILHISSPCVDAGDSSGIYNDVEESAGSATAKFPSRGILRNDMGAYGGGGAALIPSINLVTGIENFVPADFNMKIFPNPGNGVFSVTYYLPLASEVEMKITDINGRKIGELLNENQSSGAHSLTFSDRHLSGIYILQLRINGSWYTKMLTIQ